MISLDTINAAFHSIEIKNAAGNALSIDGSGYITLTNTGFTVTASALDIRDLAYGTDSVTVWQGTDPWVIDGSIVTNQGGFSTWTVNKQAVDDDPVVQLVSSPLANRLMINIQNRGANEVYLDAASGVSVNSFQLPARSSVEWQLDAASQIWAVCDAGKASDLRIVEFAA
jgi:hypothetical protein